MSNDADNEKKERVEKIKSAYRETKTKPRVREGERCISMINMHHEFKKHYGYQVVDSKRGKYMYVLRSKKSRSGIGAVWQLL